MNSNQNINFGFIEHSIILQTRDKAKLQHFPVQRIGDCTPHNVWANTWWKYKNFTLAKCSICWRHHGEWLHFQKRNIYCKYGYYGNNLFLYVWLIKLKYST